MVALGEAGCSFAACNWSLDHQRHLSKGSKRENEGDLHPHENDMGHAQTLNHKGTSSSTRQGDWWFDLKVLVTFPHWSVCPICVLYHACDFIICNEIHMLCSALSVVLNSWRLFLWSVVQENSWYTDLNKTLWNTLAGFAVAIEIKKRTQWIYILCSYSSRQSHLTYHRW